MGQEHPLIAALDKASEGEESYADKLIAAAGGDPNWHKEASWAALAANKNPDHMEITEEAVKCYRLDQDNDIVDNRVYVGGEGRPTSSRMVKIQQEVEAEQNKPIPGIRSQDVEVLFSSIIGVVVGLFAVGVLLYYTLNFSFFNKIYDVYKSITATDRHRHTNLAENYSTFWNWWVDLFTRIFCLPNP
jgi:hypothetical protein